MIIAGLQKFSLLDFPEHVCATIFTQGCNFCCPFCHNVELWEMTTCGSFSVLDILAFLRKRQKVLHHVCMSGGEPTLQHNLSDVLAQMKALGYAVKLDTNGSHPEVLKSLLSQHLLDYIALDLKAPAPKYSLLAGVPIDFSIILESLHLIEQSGVNYQVRTTYVQPLLDEHDLIQIRSFLKRPDRYHVQPFRETAHYQQYLSVYSKQNKERKCDLLQATGMQ